MTAIIPNPLGTLSPAARAKLAPTWHGIAIGVFRRSSDPLFFMSVTLDNIVVGSRYRITRASDGLELATGVVATSPEVVNGVPAFSSGMLTDITVRKSSGSPNYKIFDTAVFANPLGVSAYILQQLDE